MKAGRFVCVEGIDGAGKTTLVRSLVDGAREAGLRVHSLHLRSLFERDLGEGDDHDADSVDLTTQDKAFVGYSRLSDFYLREMVPLIESCDLLVLDRYKWSYIVRWACRDVRWSVLTAVGSLASLVPEPAHTLLLDAEPFAAHRRKMVAGITLSPSETLGRRNSQSSREAFVNLQTRAAGYYDKLFEHAPAGSASRFDSALGQDAVGQQALQWLNAWLGR